MCVDVRACRHGVSGSRINYIRITHVLMCTACKCTYITRKHTNVHTTHSYSTPLKSCTHAHRIGVSRFGASLQHRAQTGCESEARTNKQQLVLVVVRNVDLCKVLRKRCLHLVVFGALKRRFAVLG